MKPTVAVARDFLKSSWQAVCRPLCDQRRRLSQLRYCSLRSALAALLFAPLAALHADADSKPAPDLKPGTRMILKFPELPQMLYAMQSGQEATTQAYLALPENYSPERRFPLFVFLYGGHGGPGAGPGRGQQIMENKDCIFVNLPLFKKKFDPDGPFKGLLITTEQDGETICQTYTAMLKRIDATIPNIDTAHNIIGGMSNGATSIVAIFETGDAYLMSTFQNLVLSEGGWHSIKTFDRYRGKGILYLYGDYVGQNNWLGKKMREDLPNAVKKLDDAVKANQLNATGHDMKDTGHDMPAEFNADVKTWVLKQLAQQAMIPAPPPLKP
jgi:predicted peptidase